MKKIQLLFLFLLGLSFGLKAQITNPAPYCAYDYQFAYNMFGSVTVNGTTHTTGTEGNVGTVVDYRYFNTQVFPDMTIGANNTISIFSYSVNDGEPIYFAVYIDINHNNIFDADEVFVQNNNTINAALNTFGAADQTLTRTFAMPATALAGQTRMRVIRGDGPFPYSATNTLAPCHAMAFGYGVCYDYNVNLTGGGPVTPVAAFSGNPLNGQTNITNITFTDATTNVPTSWAWSFTPNNVSYQNGTSAASQNPVVKFTTPGTYTVALTATNAAGNNTHTKTNYITITNPPPPATAFTANNLGPVTNTSTVTFTDQTANGNIR